MPARKGKARPPLAYEAVSPTARLNSVVKNTFNFARDVSDLYANTSISGLKKRSRSQPADQQAMLMGDINIVGPRPASATQSPNFTEKIGGPRAAVALNSKARMASNLYDNHINIQGAFAAAMLTQSGTSTTINIAASTLQAGDLLLSYNSGSINPGSLGLWNIYADDPDFLGGAVVYQASSSSTVVTSKLGRIFFGSITTLTAGGGAGGGGGGSGGRPLK